MPETEIKTVNSMFAGRTTEIPWIAIQKKGRRSFALLPETEVRTSLRWQGTLQEHRG